ncbi:MAG: hypothetical protein GX547_10295 [Phycisphaerae bacterium]|nr:hypothetical protein [Phycisphaerae bacterium]
MLRTSSWLTVLLCGCVLLSNAVAEQRGGNYLIVSAPLYVNSAPLNEFIAHRVDCGFNVLPVYSPPAGTTKEAIKAYIQSLWGTADQPKYLLIVGDTDSSSTSGNNTIPHWIGEGSRHGATDLPYACMDADPVSWYPDIYHGRFSVRDITTLQHVVDKTIRVETGGFSDPDYIRRAVLLANDDPTIGADAQQDHIINTYLTPAGFTGTRVYADLGGSTAQVAAAVNAGVLFTVYIGHSDDTGWWSPGFNRSNVQSLTNNGLYGLAMGWSCHTSQYEYSECFGETWLRVANRGAAAYLSASGFIWWSSSADWECSRRMENYFFQSCLVDNICEVRPAWDAALGRLYNDPDFGPYSSYTINIFEEFVLLGDPALRLPLRALDIGLPDEVDEFIPPDTPTQIRVRITRAGEGYVPGSALLHYSYDGGEYLTAPMTAIGGDLFVATLPAPGCGASPRFYFSAQGDQGTTVYLPEEAPSDVYTATVAVITSIALDDFEADEGWTVWSDSSLTSGAWQRAVPVSTGATGAPTADFDGSGKCFVTDNRTPNFDVDGGPTILTSPVYDLTGLSNPYVRYASWMYCDDTVAPAKDFLDVELSADGGGTWVPAEHYSGNGGWEQRDIRVRDFVPVTGQFQIRFSVSDNPNNSVTEAGVDALWVYDRACEGPGLPGDLNCDGVINVFDIDPFVLALTDEPGYASAFPDCEVMYADINGDGAVNVFDIDPFVELLTGN